MKLRLQRQIYFFTFSSCFLFIMLVISVLWSIHVAQVALERERYANKVEGQSNILKQFIISEDIYASHYDTTNWQALSDKFNDLLKLSPQLTPHQQTIQNSIESQSKNVQRLFNAINNNQLKNADERIKEHLKLKLMAQLEAIISDSQQLFSIVRQDISQIIKQQVIFILSTLMVSLFMLLFGAIKLVKIFKISLQEVKTAFAQNRSGHFQVIALSNESEEFNSIATAFNNMNKELSETTISLESMKKIVEERTQVLKELSNTDPLTKVPNRRSLFERGSAEFSRVQRVKSPLSIILLDCDLFKGINDKYGHLFGDEVLKHLCKICVQEIRKIDFFARYGGEEFIIILPGSTLDGAVTTAERIQSSLATSHLSCEGQAISVTVSIGISILNDSHRSFEDLIKDADRAMYQAKDNGRNRIEVFQSSPE